MKSTIVAFFMMGLLLGADAPKEDPVKAEKDSLQGKWSTEPILLDTGKKWTELAIDADRLSWHNNVNKGTMGMGTVVNFHYTLEPTKKPKQIDLVWSEFANKGKVQQGIYRLDGDTLVLCLATLGKERPKVFEAKEGSGHTLLTLKRKKP